MLDLDEAAAVAEQFGVSEEQVRRDHVLSHLLAVLSRRHPRDVVFFGGTALARTHLPYGRLSEDLDLLATPRRAVVVGAVENSLAVGARRELGQLRWEPALSAVRGVSSAVLRTAQGLSLRIQLLDPEGFPSWPTERQAIFQRYSDVPATELIVPTLAAFAASKTAAWHDRHAPRDLFDLWGLARAGAISADAAQLFAHLGPTGRPPSQWMFDRSPSRGEWTVQLGAQTRLSVGPEEALAVVRSAWGAAQ